MSYQQQQYPQYQAQSPMGQQFQQRTQGFIGSRYDQTVSQEVQGAVADLDRLANVAEWAKMKACERGLTRVARSFDDIGDLAHVEKKLILRESPFAEPVGQAVLSTIQNAVQELQQHASEPEVQETLERAQQTLNSLQQGISRLQQAGAGQPMAQAQQAPVSQPTTQAQQPAQGQPMAQGQPTTQGQQPVQGQQFGESHHTGSQQYGP